MPTLEPTCTPILPQGALRAILRSQMGSTEPSTWCVPSKGLQAEMNRSQYYYFVISMKLSNFIEKAAVLQLTWSSSQLKEASC